MKKVTVVVAIVYLISIASHSLAQSASTTRLFNFSKQTWLAFQKGDGSAMSALVTPDFTFVGPQGVLSLTAFGEATKNCSLKSFTLSDEKLKTIDSHTATLTYTAHQELECDGKPAPETLFNLDVFVNQHGKWLISTHMETPRTE